MQRMEGSTHHVAFEEEAVVQGDGVTGMDIDDVLEPCPITKIWQTKPMMGDYKK